MSGYKANAGFQLAIPVFVFILLQPLQRSARPVQSVQASTPPSLIYPVPM